MLRSGNSVPALLAFWRAVKTWFFRQVVAGSWVKATRATHQQLQAEALLLVISATRIPPDWLPSLGKGKRRQASGIWGGGGMTSLREEGTFIFK